VKALGLVFLAGFFVLLFGSWDSPDIEVWSVSVPVWLFAIALYLLGIGAGWAAERSRAEGS
jgi:hypothetical protein